MSKVPTDTAFTGLVINGYVVATASDIQTAHEAITTARVRGTVMVESYEYEVAGPEVMPEARRVVRWAIVKKI